MLGLNRFGSMNTKIVIAVIALIVVAVGVYFFYFRKQNQAQEPEIVGSGQSKGKIVLYSSSGCPHCINLKDDWEKFLNKSPINGYKVVTMEDAESDILETEDVQ